LTADIATAILQFLNKHGAKIRLQHPFFKITPSKSMSYAEKKYSAEDRKIDVKKLQEAYNRA